MQSTAMCASRRRNEITDMKIGRKERERTYEHATKRSWTAALSAAATLTLSVLFAGCRSPSEYRKDADRAAYDIVDRTQKQVFRGRTVGFTLEKPSDTLRRRLLLDQEIPHSDAASLGANDVARIPQWPDATYGTTNSAATNGPLPAATKPLRPSLLETLQIAARGSREYQDQKELVFLAALQLDLERDAFRNTWTGQIESMLGTDGSGDEQVSGSTTGGKLGLSRKLMSGGEFTMNLSLDLVKLLTQGTGSALGAMADATLSLPLLRGSGRFVVTEPLTRAERDVVYALYTFEQFKRAFAVSVASEYLGVLQWLDQMKNARDNYGRLVKSTRRAQRLADAGQLPAIQVDQALQDELRARNRWISAKLNYERQLDAFKLLLGLPPDAALELDPAELSRQAERAASLAERSAAQTNQAAATNAAVVLLEPSREGGGRLEMDPDKAVRLALSNRLDLRTQIGRVFDAQRGVAVAADQLRADLTLLGHAGAGESRSLASADQGNAKLDFAKGQYSSSLLWKLPLKRTSERNLYRAGLIDFEKAVRGVQELEDRIKLDVRDELRSLIERRETVMIQAKAVQVARRRLDSTTMFLEAGRAQIRDVLEAEEAMVSAQNALSTALVDYRVGELKLQRDMGVLEIDEQGLWKEYVPADSQDGKQ